MAAANTAQSSRTREDRDEEASEGQTAPCTVHDLDTGASRSFERGMVRRMTGGAQVSTPNLDKICSNVCEFAIPFGI